MSNPKNELGKFRSYSYHHILMVCNNTQAAEELTRTSEITAFQKPIIGKRFEPRQIGNDEKNKYVTLIDGTSDALFYITEASWENIIAMEDYIGEGNIPQSTSMSLEGELEIIEPLGANFLNVLVNVCDALDTDPVGLLFVLKTIFVGHNDDGGTEMISNIKPLLFINYDLTAIFDSSGSKYRMMFVGAVNGFGKLPQTQQIVNGFQFKMNPADSLAETFNKLGDAIDKAYLSFEQKAKSDYAKVIYDASKKEGQLLDAVGSAVQSASFFDDNYRKVKYKIFANDYTDTKYKAGDNSNVRIANIKDDGSYNFGLNIGIESIIKKIMASSVGVLDDGKTNEEGKRFVYKISSGLNSTDDEIIVEYYINKYEMLMLPYEAAYEGKEFKPTDGQFIEFDYIFTGKNVDIKEFDIKMEMGMAFFQIAATTDSYSTQETVDQGTISQTAPLGGSTSVASNNKKNRKKTPLFLGSKLSAQITRNTRNPVDSATFQTLINRQAALESIEARMTIYGNPLLLGEMQVLPSDLINKQLDKQIAAADKPKKDTTINPRWLKTPTLVKVNVKMPVDTNDVNTEYNDFWYTGYYTLFAVKQIFSDGEFLQELDMVSLPVSDKILESTDKIKIVETKKEQDQAVYKEIQNIFNVEGPQDTTTTKKTDAVKKTVKSSASRRRGQRENNKKNAKNKQG